MQVIAWKDLSPKCRVGRKTVTHLLTYSDCLVDCEFGCVAGPSHCNIHLATRPGVKLIWWSVGDNFPQPTLMPDYIDRPHYFIYYSYGTFKDAFELTIDVQVRHVLTHVYRVRQ